MDNCGGTSSFEGGYIKATDILQSDITNSSFTAGVLDTVSLRNLTSLDANSAAVICAAFVEHMTPAQLQVLAGKILEAMTASGTAPTPETTDNTLPTRVMGDRSTLLGEPEHWVSIGSGVIPCYRKD